MTIGLRLPEAGIQFQWAVKSLQPYQHTGLIWRGKNLPLCSLSCPTPVQYIPFSIWISEVFFFYFILSYLQKYYIHAIYHWSLCGWKVCSFLNTVQEEMLQHML